jgi:hypothetical protein
MLKSLTVAACLTAGLALVGCGDSFLSDSGAVAGAAVGSSR